jgi:putative FmdB family regulatory protein
MPLYEYECQQCHRRTEKIQKFSDPELTTCPHCGGKLERTLNAPAVHFSGGGWYKDLYSSAKKPAASGGDAAKSESAPASSGSSSGSTDVSASATPASSTTSPSPAPAASTPAKS